MFYGKTPFSSLQRFFLARVLSAALAASFAVAPLGAQSAASQGQAPQPTPQWQIDAGGKMLFDVVSVKEDTAAPSPTTMSSNIPLGPQDAFTPTGGLLSSTNWPLWQYMVFAYKLTASQLETVRSELPKWATTERFDIQARAMGNPTKDQYRLMMQALLADRFKLTIHYETKQLPVFAIVLDKPGKMGPHLQQHPADSPCSTVPGAPGSASAPPETVAGGYPKICGAFAAVPSSTPGRITVGARNMPMSAIASAFGGQPIVGVDRPVLDKTRLTGTFDFTMEFTPQFNGPLPPGANFTPDPNGPTFMEALKEDLGLKLEPQTGPVDVIVVDHVEQPSEN